MDSHGSIEVFQHNTCHFLQQRFLNHDMEASDSYTAKTEEAWTYSSMAPATSCNSEFKVSASVLTFQIAAVRYSLGKMPKSCLPHCALVVLDSRDATVFSNINPPPLSMDSLMKSPAVKRLNFAIAEDLMDSMNAGNSYSAELRKLYKDLDAHLMSTTGIQHQVLHISNL